MRDIYVIGSASIDLVVKSDRRPLKGETILGESFFMTTGGKGSNQAVSASRLGGKVRMVGAVGADDFGQQIIANLKENKVDVSNVESVTHVSSGTAHITLSEDDNSIIVVPGANFAVTTHQVEQVLNEAAEDAIVILQNEIPKDVILFIIDKCDELGLTTIYNPAPFIEIELDYLNKVTYFTPNETEVKELFGEDYEAIIQAYPNKMIVTLGDKGAVFYNNQLVNVPGIKADVVDTTGAGDTFNGALAVALSEDMALEDAILFANKAASISVTGLGAQGGMPYREVMTDV
ncbi:ribokinase [Macrococcoides canis]|uniref:ribokinase n=1 Tax=Macrococcoides canis TaxID=1855823 RepID=UPI001AEC662E|nr:ribokinase [Macrococcus canis]QTQ08584.1 ribokinase [Macrococcus canis]